MQDEESSGTVSIIIPTKNEGDVLEQCLKSVFDQSVSSNEVIIVDGGSTDSTLEIAKKFNVKVIREGRFSSPANARNLGAENAKGQILLIMDADVILDRDCLKNAIEIFADRNTIVVIPSSFDRDHSYLESIQRKWNEARTTVNVGFGKSKTAGLVVFLRKEVFEKVKFDTSYGFGEDDDFYARLEKEFKDYNVLVAENCKVISHFPHTIRELSARYMWWGRTFLSYLVKHFSFKSVLNMSSLLLPFVVTLTLIASFVSSQAVIVLIFFLSVFIIRILIVCARSKSASFVQFAFFDFMRSFFFVIGLAQSPFTRKKGR